MDFVWMLSEGEDYEGGHLLSVHATKESAFAATLERGDEDYEHGIEWQLRDQSCDCMIWRDGGCGWREIRRAKVLP